MMFQGKKLDVLEIWILVKFKKFQMDKFSPKGIGHNELSAFFDTRWIVITVNF